MNVYIIKIGILIAEDSCTKVVHESCTAASMSVVAFLSTYTLMFAGLLMLKLQSKEYAQALGQLQCTL
jgi:hypothetical protein